MHNRRTCPRIGKSYHGADSVAQRLVIKKLFVVLVFACATNVVSAQNTFQDAYNDFKQQTKSDYEDFRQQANMTYAE